MPTLSVCVIAKNEQDVIGRMLDCARQFADEMIVADTGSVDNTKDIATQKGAKVYDFEWCDDFAKARNFSFSKATCDFIMWLDCDDVVESGEIKKILDLKQRLDEADVFMLRYVTDCDENGNPSFVYFRERIVRRSLNLLWTDRVHEVIVPQGKTLFCDIDIKHKKQKASPKRRNLDIYLGMLSEGVAFSPRQRFYFASELMQNGLGELAAAQYEKVLDSDAMAENKVQACINLSWLYDGQARLSVLLRALSFAEPSPELCVRIGTVLLDRGDIANAEFWYKNAIRPLPEHTLAFVNPHCYGYIPLVQLGLCRYRQGDIKGAAQYTSRALLQKPHDKLALANLAFFEKELSCVKE